MPMTIGACVPLSNETVRKPVIFKTEKPVEVTDNEARQFIAFLWEQIQILQARVEALENKTESNNH